MIKDEERQKIIRENGVLYANYISQGVAAEYVDKYDILYYDELTAAGLHALLKKKYADPDERQNSAPDIATIFRFLQEHPNFTCHGYIVTPKRSDCRVSVEGVEGVNCSPEDISDFALTFRRADEFRITTGDDDYPECDGIRCYCWYD